jgi:S-adenosylmethionine:tRNA ribosyltransferase-isomerase
MHAERIAIDAMACDTILKTQSEGKRVIAVGTTSVRVLESVMQKRGKLEPYQGETDIFIYPGFQFQMVDALLTNFHLPESTLLMLVSAFAGRERILRAYHHAINHRYRFYSYGDAMWIS